VNALEEFRALGINFVSLHEGVDTSTPNGRLVFGIFASIAEFERELVRCRVRSGLAAARARGKRRGRPRAVVESTLLAVIGGVLGCALAIPMNGLSTSTGQTTSFSEIAFAFKITPPGLIAGMVFAALMGFAGGLLPAVRAARLPIASALREA
jgi:Resolvase, N terminal domain